MLCIFRCCRMCNISLSESISHVEPGILVFDCGKEILYLSNEMIFLFKIIIAFFHRHNGFIYHQILLHILKQRLQNMYRLFYFTKSTFKGTYQKNDCKYKHCKIYIVLLIILHATSKEAYNVYDQSVRFHEIFVFRTKSVDMNITKKF